MSVYDGQQFPQEFIKSEPSKVNSSQHFRELSAGAGTKVFKVNKEGVFVGGASYATAPFKIDYSGNVTAASITIKGHDIADNLDTSGNWIGNLINARMDTATKKILSDFDFGSADYSGGVKSGDITWNTSTGALTGGSGVVVFRKGILGATAGVATFTIDATTGDATFAGTLSAAGGTLGTITSGTITGVTIQTATSGQRVKLTSANYVQFLYNAVQKGKIGATYTGNSLQIDTADDIYFTVSGVNKIKFDSNGDINFAADEKEIHWAGGAYIKGYGSYIRLGVGTEVNGNFEPDSDNDWKCGGSSRRWSEGWFEDITVDDLTCNVSFGGCGSISGCAYHEVNLLTDEQKSKRKEFLNKGDRTIKEKKEINHTGFEVGDVLCWGHRGLKKSSLDTTACVVSVAGKKGMPITMGAEPVKVVGKIARNSFLVTSPVEGHARMWTGKKCPPRGCVIAMALEDKTDNKNGTVKAMIQKF